MFAAIDIGSNAIRLAIAQNSFLNTTVIRTPLRLGADVFSTGSISEESIDTLVTAMKKYRSIMDDNQIEHYRAVATSAFREANNSKDIIKKIKIETNIHIELISGLEEATLIHDVACAELKTADHPVLVMDIGGGSVEFITSIKGEIQYRTSLSLGTVRLLNQFPNHKGQDLFSKCCELVQQELLGLEEVMSFVTQHKENGLFIGTGGNFRRLKKISKQKTSDGKSPVSYKAVATISEELAELTYTQRMDQFKLRADRADVILPALALISITMEHFELSQVHIPNAGLKNGVIMKLQRSSIA